MEKVLFKGKDIQEIGLNKYRREDISIVFQSYNLIYYMNALENVMSALEIAGIKRKDKKEYCLSILEQLGLSKMNVKEIFDNYQEDNNKELQLHVLLQEKSI